MSDLQNYGKISSIEGTGIGAGNFLALTSSDNHTIKKITSMSVCNSNANDSSFSLWQIDNTEWASTWQNGTIAEPTSVRKDRIFFKSELPKEMTYLGDVEIIIDNLKYLIFEAPVGVSITIWGITEGNN